MAHYIPIIGLEVHAELDTQSKLFCRCPNTSSELQTPPNTAICPVCVGLPGALPVLNKQAVAATVKLGRSLGCQIPNVTKWDRKNYFYPDLPKGYQISQYDEPLCQGGELTWFDRQGHEHTVALTRIHLEEDTGKLTHPAGADYSLIDYNRSSIPLLELVTEPVIASADEARQFCEEYQHRLRELGIAEASMDKGQMRCEANISVVPVELANDPKRRLSGTKVEVKNLNSFRSLERAISYEIERQSAALEAGEPLVQETRGWNEAKGETYSMRTKETADDYRYFPEPDLYPLDLDWLAHGDAATSRTRQELFRELMAAGVPADQVHTVLADAKRRVYLVALLERLAAPELQRLAVQWINQEPKLLDFSYDEVTAVLGQLAAGTLRPSLFKDALLSAKPGELVDEIAQQAGAMDEGAVTGVVTRILEANPAEVTRYRAGEAKLFGFFMGQVRKELQGKGDAVVITEELKRQLGE